MFDFHFIYSDGNTYDVKGVTKIRIGTTNGTKEFEGDQILTVTIPLYTIFLYSQNGNVTVSGTNLVIIDVRKHDE